jgi:hypothetical protein
MSSQKIFPFTTDLSLSLTIFFVLKSAQSEISIASPAFFQLVLLCHIFLHPVLTQL